jgi:hypothetical protein
VTATIVEESVRMPEENVEFKMLEAKLVGSDTVVFRLEDGAMVKIKVDIERAGVATNFKNPDGSPHYSINSGLKISVIPSEKKFFIPKSQLPTPPHKESIMKPI